MFAAGQSAIAAFGRFLVAGAQQVPTFNPAGVQNAASLAQPDAAKFGPAGPCATATKTQNILR
jgi:hypothetical protein